MPSEQSRQERREKVLTSLLEAEKRLELARISFENGDYDKVKIRLQQTSEHGQKCFEHLDSLARVIDTKGVV